MSLDHFHAVSDRILEDAATTENCTVQYCSPVVPIPQAARHYLRGARVATPTTPNSSPIGGTQRSMETAGAIRLRTFSR